MSLHSSLTRIPMLTLLACLALATFAASESAARDCNAGSVAQPNGSGTSRRWQPPGSRAPTASRFAVRIGAVAPTAARGPLVAALASAASAAPRTAIRFRRRSTLASRAGAAARRSSTPTPSRSAT